MPPNSVGPVLCPAKPEAVSEAGSLSLCCWQKEATATSEPLTFELHFASQYARPGGTYGWDGWIEFVPNNF